MLRKRTHSTYSFLPNLDVEGEIKLKALGVQCNSIKDEFRFHKCITKLQQIMPGILLIVCYFGTGGEGRALDG